ncbi:helix-turn-helix and ligand-binding sensor domain-containing protein [Aquimarina celericrescens]|uniref:Triple tyrosine motif-containing protein n=1 Tax=Aquimarina celericrescens TaxID=1964542 RepID=A0ABW5AYH9_9FLAO|nr:LuxR family transcriptional regulator [Aquimarina celericrescens]
MRQLNYLIFILSFFSYSQELPPIQSYFPNDYQGEPQNWSITQSSGKQIYTANNKSLLEFDGFIWQQYPSPNGTVIRAIKAIADRIYLGASMEFGYWGKNDFGLLEYTSISDKIKSKLVQDEQFWSIEQINNRVLFQSFDRIYIYDTITEEITTIESYIAIISMFVVNSKLYYQEVQKGIFTLEKGQPKLIIDVSSEFDPQTKVINIAEKDGGLVLITNNKGFYFFKDQRLQIWKTPSESFLKDVTIFSGIRAENGNYVLGTISKGLIILSENGDIIHSFDQKDGLSNNTVLSTFEDIENNLWLGLDNGISCININSPVKIYQDPDGSIGTTYASAIFEDDLYLGTNQGLFYKKKSSNDSFKLIKGTEGQVWNLFKYQQVLFCAHDKGVFKLKNTKLEKLTSHTGVWGFKKVSGHPDMLLFGSYSGLGVLEKEDKKWKYSKDIGEFNYSAKYLEIYDDKIWVNHEYEGLFKIEVDQSFEKVVNLSEIKSVEKTPNSGITTYNNDLFYANEKGIYIYDKISEKFKKDSLLSNIYSKGDYTSGKLINDQHNTLWSFTKENLSFIRESEFTGDYEVHNISIPKSLRNEMVGFENMLCLGNSQYLLGRTNGYLILDTKMIQPTDLQIRLNQISIKQRGGKFERVKLNGGPKTFKSGLNMLYFRFSVPNYDKYIIPKYQYKLKGFYNEWSDWSTKPEVTFENLPFGEYSFVVRSNQKKDKEFTQVSYDFAIERPVYIGNLAIFIYTLIFVVLLIGVHRAYKNYYRKKEKKIIDDNQKQMNLKQLEIDQEIMRLKNEKLIQDIENKNRELANSTMNIVKKNEILNSIRKELKKISSGNGSSSIKNIEQIIKDNLNSGDDWKQFEDALNSTDNYFLKKLKAKHKDLTPSDLRFCTYLRLNLSSKEIAPLLCISLRSVEIKRYRLRKKLKLNQSENLVSYILEI